MEVGLAVLIALGIFGLIFSDGAMPIGLYGNDNVNFPVPTGVNPASASGHINVGAPLFPFGTKNVMSPALAFSEVQQFPFTRFNSLNLTYLLERVIHNN